MEREKKVKGKFIVCNNIVLLSPYNLAKLLLDKNRFGYIVNNEACIIDTYECYVLLMENCMTLDIIYDDHGEGEIEGEEVKCEDDGIGKRSTRLDSNAYDVGVDVFIETIVNSNHSDLNRLNFYVWCRQKGILLKQPDIRKKIFSAYQSFRRKSTTIDTSVQKEQKPQSMNSIQQDSERIDEIESGGVQSGPSHTTDSERSIDFYGYKPHSLYSTTESKCNPSHFFYLFTQQESIEGIKRIQVQSHPKAPLQCVVICSLVGFTPIHISNYSIHTQ